MAEIYRATLATSATSTPRTVAIKRLRHKHVNDRELVDMFLTEADVGKLLNHPNVVQVYESGLFEGQPYIVMQFIPGVDLAKLLYRLRRLHAQFPVELALFIASQVLRALDYIHRAKSRDGTPLGMIHRDVTPSNIFLAWDGDVKLGDFGVARVACIDGTETQLEIHGKISYLPPEIWTGNSTTHLVDLWGVAATLYEMLTLTRPYGFVREEEILSRRRPRITPAHLLIRSFDPRLSDILEKALHRRASKRYRDVLSFYTALRDYRCQAKLKGGKEALGALLLRLLGADSSASEVLPSSEVGHSNEFERPDYQAPWENSVTQRIQLVEQRRSMRARLATGAAVAAVAVVGTVIGVHTLSEESSKRQALPAAQNLHPEDPPPWSGGTPAHADPTGNPMQRGDPDNRPTPNAGDGAQPTQDMPERLTRSGWGSLSGSAEDDGGLSDEELGIDGLKIPLRRRFRARYQEAEELRREQSYDEAAAAFRAALRFRSDSIPAQVGLARTLLATGEDGEARDLLQAVLRQRPDDPNALLVWAHMLRNEARNAEARAAFESVVAAAPQSEQAEEAQEILDDW